MKSIVECVMSVPDPRRGNHRKHELADMLFASLVSVLCGYDSYVAFARFTELNLEWMRGLGFAFKNGVPSHDAFRYAFSVVDHGLFSACLRNVSDILRDKARKGSVSIDGKALRRCMNRGGKTPIPSMCKCASVQTATGQLSAPAPVSAGGGWRWKLVLTVDAFAHLHICTLERKPRKGGGACAEGQPEDAPRGDAAAFRQGAEDKPASLREIRGARGKELRTDRETHVLADRLHRMVRGHRRMVRA